MNYIKTALFSGVGRRKRSYAKVYILPGQGKISINKKSLHDFFFNDIALIKKVKKPLEVIQSNQTFDIVGFVHGGGCNGQAEALCLSISKSLAVIDLDTRKLLKEQRLLQTDSRVVERKKYGLKKARKASQYSKR